MAPERALRPLTRLLDISRLVRRTHATMTGIDRVEFAYLRALAERPEPFFALARTRLGYVLLDAEGARGLVEALRAGALGPLDTLGHIMPGLPRRRREAEATLRRLASASCLPPRLTAMLRRHLPDPPRYINVGHANLTPRVLRALHACDARITVLVHDVIPLEAPYWQRPGTEDRFRRFLARVERHADLVIYNSHDTRRRAERRMQDPPPACVAHLGVTSVAPEPLPPELALAPPYFVCLGTIEPRKNHALLLDIWRAWGPEAPPLVLAGRRGWQNAAVFDRLDARPPNIIEAPGLRDGQISTLLDGSNGLLFPSHLEGFGLPPMEAVLRGVPVLAQPLPVLKEVLGDVPHYVDGSDQAGWMAAIADMATSRRSPPAWACPTWQDHFNAVLRLT